MAERKPLRVTGAKVSRTRAAARNQASAQDLTGRRLAWSSGCQAMSLASKHSDRLL